MMYDYESDLIEFWGKVIFFFFLALFSCFGPLYSTSSCIHSPSFSFPLLFIPPLTFSITLSFLSAYVFFTRFFYSWTDNHAHFYKNSFRKEISIKDPDSRRAWRSGLVGVCQSNIFPCMSLPLFSSSL